jgi:predicted lysophospholipase L1 biosynthesis ABC-type transport system permease subunit
VGLAKLPQWTIPADVREVAARPSPTGAFTEGIYLTPKAAAATSAAIGGPIAVWNLDTYLSTDSAHPDVVERVRNAAAGIDPTMRVDVLHGQETAAMFSDIQRGLFIGALATLLLIGASLLVTMVEQLRDRRRLLAALVAFGTRRSTLSWSVLWQATVPVVLGIVLAIVAGTALGALLLRMVGASLRFDWQIIGGICACAATVVLLVTVLSLPALWRLMRPDGLRAE